MLRLSIPDRTLVADHLSRAIFSADSVEISMTDGEVTRTALSRRSSARSILGLSNASALPMKAEARAVLLRWIAIGRRCVAELERGRSVDLDQLAERQGCSRRHVERMIDYAFLALDLVKAIADGRLPRGVSARALADAPMLWSALSHRIDGTIRPA